MYDLVIRNGKVLDGTGAEAFRADVAIKDGKIVCVGLVEGTADTVIDATGLTVTPGFIDSHSHSDSAFLSYPEQKEKLEQGITFSITGQCGGSAAPKKDRKVSEFLELVGPQGSGAALLVGHGTLRYAVMGNQNRKATEEEMEQMKSLLRESLEAGAIGMSLGLIYIPGCYSDTEEVLALAKVVAEYDGVLASHIRNENDGVIEAVEEYLHVIRQSGCRAVFSHHKTAGPKNHGKVHTTLAMIDQANAEGADIYLDVYPYIASHTSLSTRYFPKRFHPEGEVNVCKCLSDPQIRGKIKEQLNEPYPIMIASCKNTKQYEGMYLEDIAKLLGKDICDTAFDLILENENSIGACYFTMSEEDVKTVISHPRAMICTDSGVAMGKTKYHPRLRASFPRALSRYPEVPMPEMIRKMTSLPASVYKLSAKGRIAEGYDADICILDTETLCDNADYVNCSAPNSGLAYVLIDGKIAVKDNQSTGVLAAVVQKR